MLGVKVLKLQPIDELKLFSLALFERDQAFRFNISEQVVSDIIVSCI